MTKGEMSEDRKNQRVTSIVSWRQSQIDVFPEFLAILTQHLMQSCQIFGILDPGKIRNNSEDHLIAPFEQILR